MTKDKMAAPKRMYDGCLKLCLNLDVSGSIVVSAMTISARVIDGDSRQRVRGAIDLPDGLKRQIAAAVEAEMREA